MSEYYDLVLIGSGPAGEKGAAQAAYFGKKVALVERASQLGGASIRWGIPSKPLRETALYFSGLRQSGLYSIGSSLNDEPTVSDLMYREHEVVNQAEAMLQHNIDLCPGPRVRIALTDRAVDPSKRPSAGWTLFLFHFTPHFTPKYIL